MLKRHCQRRNEGKKDQPVNPTQNQPFVLVWIKGDKIIEFTKSDPTLLETF